jgi:membrane associated rhomboid family serine protease
VRISGTDLILLLTILVSLLGLVSPRFIDATELRPYRIARGAGFQTLLTSGFVHADLGHLIFNLITLYSFGPSLESEIGTPRFLLLYLSGMLVSSIGTCVKHRDDPRYAALGASGAILAVLFASIVYFPQQEIIFLLLPVPIPAPLFALGYLAYSYYSARRAARARAFPGTPSAAPAPVPGENPAAPTPASPAGGLPPGLPELPPPSRTNHDAHFFGALTGFAFALIQDPERFRVMLQYFTGRP